VSAGGTDLSGKVAVVTGGSRGIGRAVAHGLAQAGADVVVASRKLESCTLVAKEITAATGRRALPVPCHVGRWADCDALVEATYAEFGRCDVLVNNAGVAPVYPDLESITEEYFDKVTAVNLRGPFRLGAVFGARMARGAGGSIINVSSIGSLRPTANELVYACAKAGLNALTIGLANAYGPKVRCNGLLPGAVLTDIADAWEPEHKERITQNPLGRPGEADDFVGPALWLAGDQSAWVSGTLVRVDGGRYGQTG
jgi:NAD(P)-dependent dehydrogenase (short-subunit alcohol dehydrogenase family)